MELFRPVGMNELRLIYETGMTAFPPRLPEQPIFYPVLNFPYAEKIARDWNTRQEPWAGYVTRFEVEDNYISKFTPEVVGASWHAELWVPATELAEFNTHIRPPIEIVGAYFGKDFRGPTPYTTEMRKLDIAQQFEFLAQLDNTAKQSLQEQVIANDTALFLNYPYWLQPDFFPAGISTQQRDKVILAIQNVWQAAFPNIPLATLP